MTDLRAVLGERVAERRRARRLTQAELATLLGWPQPRVSELERGRSWPQPGRLEAIAAALRCEPADLLEKKPTEG